MTRDPLVTDDWIHLAAKKSAGDRERNIFLSLNRYFVLFERDKCVTKLLESNLSRRYCQTRRTEAGAGGFEFIPPFLGPSASAQPELELMGLENLIVKRARRRRRPATLPPTKRPRMVQFHPGAPKIIARARIKPSDRNNGLSARRTKSEVSESYARGSGHHPE
jgi:hypothetical protein